MPLQFKTEITAAHVRAATAGIFWRQVLQPLPLGLAGMLLIGLQLILHALYPPTPLALHVGLTLLLAGTVLGAAWVAKSHYEAEAARNFQRFEGAPVQVSLRPDAYAYDAAWGRGEIPWSRFQSFWRLKTVWVLLQHAQGGVSVLLPAADLHDEAQAYLQARLLEAHAKGHG